MKDKKLAIAYFGDKGALEFDGDSIYLGKAVSIGALQESLVKIDSSHLLIVDLNRSILLGNPEGFIEEFEVFDLDVLFPSSAHFQFDDEVLRYYFWKYYPRINTTYEYLDSGSIIGKTTSIKNWIEEIVREYATDFSFHDLCTRHLVDSRLGVIDSSLKIGLDYHQDLFGPLDGRCTAFKYPTFNWIHEELYDRYEKKFLLERDALHIQDKPWDTAHSKRRSFSFNDKYKSTPSIWIANGGALRLERIRGQLTDNPFKGKFKYMPGIFLVYLKSLWVYLMALLINRGTKEKSRIFRYARNKHPEWHDNMMRFMDHLKKKEGFTFAHFNDGEMTFVKKYLEENHSETWFGRRQQKYNRDLGERLTNALKLKRENYYVGIPCSTSHPRLRKLADEIVENDSGVVPAMMLHHNLRYYPNIIGELKNREVFFVMNEHQKLDVLDKLGVEIKEENKMIVPFVNSYLLYDELKDRKFPEGSVVILICGMLAKIIIPEWFRNNPDVTFLALGSSLDDFIQRTNTKFQLYPKTGLPLTCNIQPTKFFTFGWKNPCPECWDMAQEP